MKSSNLLMEKAKFPLPIISSVSMVSHGLLTILINDEPIIQTFSTI